MPELPEVETIRRQLDAELNGWTVTSVTTDNEKMFRPSFKAVSKVIVGQKIEAVERQAKLIIFRLKGLALRNKNASESFQRRGLKEIWLLFHLKLTGRLLVRKLDAPADYFVHAVFTLKRFPQGHPFRQGERGGLVEKELRFSDARKFGFVKLVTDKEEMEELLAGYGPEPFKNLKLSNFTQILKSSARPVKIVLLDQAKISGIGNIYANDALWLAGLDPRAASNKVTKKQSKKLYAAVLTVLRRGLKYGGASDQWYRQVHGEEGKYQQHFLVYGQVEEKCQRCGDIIKRIVVGGRGTFICSTCQRL